MRILVADDDFAIRELVGLYLGKEGYTVEYAHDGEETLAAFRRDKPDLVILDVGMPAIDGFEVCRRIRAESEVPVLMLTARNDEVDRVVGLELGADDYLAKPFSPRELVARVRAVLRRYTATPAPRSLVTLERLEIDKQRRTVTVDGSPITLRTREFDLLATLAENFEIVLTRNQLMELVWGYDYLGESRTIDVHVQHLRPKLQGSGLQIETVRGIGYRLALE